MDPPALGPIPFFIVCFIDNSASSEGVCSLTEFACKGSRQTCFAERRFYEFLKDIVF